MKEVFIIGINGAPHKNGRCAGLLKRALKSCEKHGARTQLIHLADEEKTFYSSYYSRKTEKDLAKIEKMLLEADGFILASPVFWMNISGLMKNFIDKLTVFEIRGFQLEGKTAGFIVTEEEAGGIEAINSMAAPLNHMGVLTPPYSMLFYNYSSKKSGLNEWMDKDIELLGKNIVTFSEILKSVKPHWGYGKKYKQELSSADKVVRSMGKINLKMMGKI